MGAGVMMVSTVKRQRSVPDVPETIYHDSIEAGEQV